jgi:hypothetical protein
MFHAMEAGFACGSMVLFFLFTKNFHKVKIFCEKKGIFRPAGACPERHRMGRHSLPDQ